MMTMMMTSLLLYDNPREIRHTHALLTERHWMEVLVERAS